jgi:hypothetical protein
MLARVQGLPVKIPAPGVLNATVPAGAVPVPTATSLTNALQDDAWFTATEEGVQTTVVVVCRVPPPRENVPWLVLWIESFGV